MSVGHLNTLKVIKKILQLADRRDSVHADTPPLYRVIPPLNSMAEPTACCCKSYSVIQLGVINSLEHI